MKQKTIYTTSIYKVGDEVLLYSRTFEETNNEYFYISKKFASEGYPGNMDHNVKRFHGWRGSSYGWSVYAYGKRKVKSVILTTKTDDEYQPIYKIVVGPDLAPDEL